MTCLNRGPGPFKPGIRRIEVGLGNISGRYKLLVAVIGERRIAQFRKRLVQLKPGRLYACLGLILDCQGIFIVKPCDDVAFFNPASFLDRKIH